MKMNYRTMRWLAVATVLTACDEPLNTEPTDAIDSGTALTTARGVELGVIGAYSALQVDALYSQELVVFPDMYADNLDFTGTFDTHFQVANRDIRTTNGAILEAWEDSYDGINRTNNVLAAIPNVEDLDADDASTYRGEALFLRALNYLNLVRYFGGVPIVTDPSVGVSEESQLPRNTAAEVYAQIVADLTEAVTLLPPSGSPGRATQGAANALLARTYLEMGDWANARDAATAVIGSLVYDTVSNYRDLFDTKNSDESIFEVQYSVNDANSMAFWYFPQALGGRRGYAPSQDLFDAYEAGDERRDASIATSGTNLYGAKYHRIANGDDNVIVLRLAEMYLIRAEANARLGEDPAIVRADIDVIRNRAGLADLPATIDQEDELIDAILQERRVEFAMEGHRFFDLRRTGRAQQVLGIIAERLLFPIPQAERDVNPNLGQNPGY